MKNNLPMICVVCEREKPRNPNDPDVCNDCCERIDKIIQDQVTHARAVGMLIDGVYKTDSVERDRAVMAGFLAVFHPAMPARKVTDLLLNARSGRK